MVRSLNNSSAAHFMGSLKGREDKHEAKVNKDINEFIYVVCVKTSKSL